MNRRQFIKLISSSAIAAYALDPEKLLWVPGEKTIFIPPERRLIYAAEISENELHSFGVAVTDLSELHKFMYEVIEGKMYKHMGVNYKNVQIFESIKGLHYEPDSH
jgi:hypothetical protein